MKKQHIILIVLGIVFALMVGSFFLGIALLILSPDAVHMEVDRLFRHRVIVFLVGAFLYYIGYTSTKSVIKRATREEVFIAEGDFGRVSVALHPVREAVKKVLRKFATVRRYKLDLYVQNKKLNVKINIKHWVGSDIKELTQDLHNELIAKLHKMLGLEGNVDVHIKVDDIS